MGTPLPDVDASGLGAWSGAGTFHSSRGTSAVERSLLMLNCPTMVVGPALSVSPPLLLVSMWLLLYTLNYMNSVQLVQVFFSDDCSLI